MTRPTRAPVQPHPTAMPHLEAWPGVPIKLPGYGRWERYEFDPSGTLLVPEGRWVDEAWRGQTYLELFALDLADPQAILEFVNTFGTLGVFSNWQLLTDGLAQYLEEDIRDQVLVDRTAVHEAPEARAWLAARVDSNWGEDPLWDECESLEEFRFGARVIRDLTRAWMFLDDSGAASQTVWELPLASWVDTWIGRRVSLAGALLSEGLTHILGAMHPRITFELVDPAETPPGLVTTRNPPILSGSHGRTPQPRPVSLGLVCALELYSHILLRTSYKQCRFDGCDRLFIFQEDRRHSGRPAATHYKSRRDALFCSPQCYRAHTQREHRRRHKL